MGHDVFVSTASADKRIVDAIAAAMEEEGIECWLASRDIQLGETWGGAIKKAVEDCKILVLTFSPHSNKSSQIKEELESAAKAKVSILVFRVKESEPSEEFQSLLGDAKWIDALTPELNDHLPKLIKAADSILGNASTRVKKKPKPKPKTKNTSKAKTGGKSSLASKTPKLGAPTPPPDNKKGEEKRVIKPGSAEAKLLERKMAIQARSGGEPKPPSAPTSTEPEQVIVPGSAQAKLLERKQAMEAKSNKAIVQPPPVKNENKPQAVKSETKPKPVDLVVDADTVRGGRGEKKSTQQLPWLKIGVLAMVLIAAGLWFFLGQEKSLTEIVTALNDEVTIPNSDEAEQSEAEQSIEPEPSDDSEPLESDVIAPDVDEQTQLEIDALALQKAQDMQAKELAAQQEQEAQRLKKAEQAKVEAAATARREAEEKAASELAAAKQAEADAAAELLKQAELEKQAQIDAQILAAKEAERLRAKAQAQKVAAAKARAKERERVIAHAEQGAANDQYKLGLIHDNGDGVPENDAEAVKWYSLAAEQGVVDAQYNLAVMYEEGLGISKSDALAYKWYQLAADQGHAMAQKSLGVMHEFGIGIPADDDQAMKWYKRAAEQGNLSAQNFLDELIHKLKDKE